MRATIDETGRVMIPRALREQVGLAPGEVDVVVDGAGLRVQPPADEDLVERDGRWIIPATGTPFDDDLVQVLRDADQR